MKISKEIKYAMIKTYIFRTPLVVERLRFQPPMQGKVKVKGAQSCLTLCDPMNYTVHGILQARILEWVTFLSLLRGIFPIQESNQDLLHCRRILYQLSYQGSPANAQTLGIQGTQGKWV